MMGKLKYSIGRNRKVGSDTVIINICSAHDCPARKKGLCQLPSDVKCYALKAERYPNVINFRKEQEKVWDELSAEEIAEEIKKLKGKEYKDTYTKEKNKLKYVRLNEAGDFRNQDDVDKASKIAELLKGILKVYTYTARSDLDFSETSSNLVVNGSGFMVDNEFKAVEEIDESKTKCNGDCRECDLCKNSNKKKIQVRYH